MKENVIYAPWQGECMQAALASEAAKYGHTGIAISSIGNEPKTFRRFVKILNPITLNHSLGVFQ